MSWLHHDHKNFESAVYQCRSACDDANWSRVRDIFDELASHYRSHVRIEEEVLFPAYEAHPDASSKPTESLRSDHTQIFNLMDNIAQSLQQGAQDRLAENLSLLYRILTKHHEKEEEIFLPMASEALYSDKDAILADMKVKLARDD